MKPTGQITNHEIILILEIHISSPHSFIQLADIGSLMKNVCLLDSSNPSLGMELSVFFSVKYSLHKFPKFLRDYDYSVVSHEENELVLNF